MSYTETKVRNNRKYYYRTVSVRDGARVTKQRKYLGADLGGMELAVAEKNADRVLGFPEALLNDQENIYLDRIKLEHARQPSETFQDRYKNFATLFTHNSTAIEGNSLTLRETECLLFDDVAPAGKSFREMCEVIGHGRAFEQMLAHDGNITGKFICELHALVMKDAVSQKYHAEIGRYRSLPVYISGLEWAPPEPEKVPHEMNRLLTWHSRKRGKIHPLVLAVRFHVEFERIHPFIDGNGRVGRLLMNYILHDAGYPMVSIPNVLKYRYYEVLEKAQQEKKCRLFLEFMLELIEDADF